MRHLDTKTGPGRFVSLAIPFILGLLFWNLILINLLSPAYQYFDEPRYVSGGLSLIKGEMNENWSHPPLAKILIGIGTTIFGDGPIGWRIMSSVFGSLVIVIMFIWGRVFFGRIEWAVGAAVLAMLNQVHFVQSRIASLEVFMFAFIVSGMCVFSYLWLNRPELTEKHANRLLAGCGLLFGLGLACKWFALIPTLTCFLLWIGDKKMGSLSSRLKLSCLFFIALPLITYFAVNLAIVGVGHPRYAPPLLPAIETSAPDAPPEKYGVFDLVTLQIEMLRAQMAFENPKHPYASAWFTWPLMLQPMWYDLRWQEGDHDEESAGIFLIGNPFIFWGGFLAVIVCVFEAIRYRRRTPFLIALFFSVLWLSWAILPRRGGFFYYYYPASMMYCFALPQACRFLKIKTRYALLFLIAAAAAFIFFYPVLADWFLPNASLFRRVWFKAWLK